MATILNHAAEEEYLLLVRVFPLASIRDGEHLDMALTEIDRLLDKSARSEAEEVYLGALTDLVETYENAHVRFPPVAGVDLLRHLMDENGLKQSDLASLFGSPSIISEVLSGKRRLALSHMEKLATRFGLPVSVFVDADAHAGER